MIPTNSAALRAAGMADRPDQAGEALKFLRPVCPGVRALGVKRSPARTTLADLQRQGGWVWAYCEGIGCGHRVPLAIAPFAIRWGLNASSDLMRERLRCSKSGVRLHLP